MVGKIIKKSLREAEPLFYNPSPSPLKERGINPVRVPNGVKGMR